MAMPNRDREHWAKLVDLIEQAKADRDLSKTLRSGTPKQVVDELNKAGITMDDLGLIFEDLEYIADRNSGRYWSPLA
jgi:hypothetical protein